MCARTWRGTRRRSGSCWWRTFHATPREKSSGANSARAETSWGWACVGGRDGPGERALDADRVLLLFVGVGEQANGSGEDEEAAGQFGGEGKLGVDGGGGAVHVHRDGLGAFGKDRFQGESQLEVAAGDYAVVDRLLEGGDERVTAGVARVEAMTETGDERL